MANRTAVGAASLKNVQAQIKRWQNTLENV